MPALASSLDPRSQDFQDNAAYHRALVEELDARLARAAEGGGEKARNKHTERGKLLVRDRITALLDPGSPFLEIAPLAAEGMYDGAAPAAGIVAGIGRVHGQEVVIVANDATVKGGTYFPMTVKKHLRAQEVARENRLPCVLPRRLRRRVPAAAGRGVPGQGTLRPHLLQPGAAERGEHPADRRRHGFVHRGRRVRAGDVRRIDHRARARHDLPRRPAAGEGRHGRSRRCRIARRRRRAHQRLRRGRPFRRRRSRRAADRAQPRLAPQPHQDAAGGTQPVREPLFAAQELYGIVPKDTRRPFDIREVIARVVDGSDFQEFKARYGKTLVCGFAHIHGYPVGIIANNGILFSESALKGAHFIELCNQRNIPLVFLQNITGFMVGRKYENAGIAKDGAKMVTAVGVLARAEVHRRDRRQLRRGQLRDVRPRLRWPLPVDVAQRAHQRDGRRTGGERALHGEARRHRSRGQDVERRRGRELQGADPRSSTSRRAIPITRARACGTTASSIRRIHAACWAWALPRRSMRRSKAGVSASSACNGWARAQACVAFASVIARTDECALARAFLSVA
jgi:3-methylcrotonyl-CoA carboxylase beta subunit